MTNREKNAINVGVYVMAAAGMVCGVTRCAGIGESVTPDQASAAMRMACHALPDVGDRATCLVLVDTAADYCDGTPPSSPEPAPAPARTEASGSHTTPLPVEQPLPPPEHPPDGGGN